MSLLNKERNYIEDLQSSAKITLTNDILEEANSYLKGSQLMELNKTLNKEFAKYEIYVEQDIDLHENYLEENKMIREVYISNKKLEGLSPRTITYYDDIIGKFIEYIDKPLVDVTTQDIRDYFEYYQNLNKCSNTSLDNVRRVLNTFFNTINSEGYIQKNPMARIKKIKSPKKVKQPYTDLEIEKMRESLSQLPEETSYQRLIKYRNQSMFELLLSSGIRLSECVNLNISDIDLQNRRFIVMGKGSKERVCYFSTKCQYFLDKLLNFQYNHSTRQYANRDCLFFSKRGDATEYRLTHNGFELWIRKLGKSCGVNAHPHKFRRTFATRLLNKGVPIEQIKELLGHANIDTTLLYAIVDEDEVKYNHNKFIE